MGCRQQASTMPPSDPETAFICGGTTPSFLDLFSDEESFLLALAAPSPAMEMPNEEDFLLEGYNGMAENGPKRIWIGRQKQNPNQIAKHSIAE